MIEARIEYDRIQALGDLHPDDGLTICPICNFELGESIDTCCNCAVSELKLLVDDLWKLAAEANRVHEGAKLFFGVVGLPEEGSPYALMDVLLAAIPEWLKHAPET